MEKVIIEFNRQHMSVISDALLNLPYRISAPVIDEINRQIIEQQATNETIKSDNSPLNAADKDS